MEVLVRGIEDKATVLGGLSFLWVLLLFRRARDVLCLGFAISDSSSFTKFLTQFQTDNGASIYSSSFKIRHSGF